MTIFSRLTITVILWLFVVAAPLYAGMEPFYKGEWGMSPDEIKTLETAAPVETNPGAIGDLELEYRMWINHTAARVTYVFKNRGLQGRPTLSSVICALELEGLSNSQCRDLGRAYMRQFTSQKNLADNDYYERYGDDYWHLDFSALGKSVYINMKGVNLPDDMGMVFIMFGGTHTKENAAIFQKYHKQTLQNYAQARREEPPEAD